MATYPSWYGAANANNPRFQQLFGRARGLPRMITPPAAVMNQGPIRRQQGQLGQRIDYGGGAGFSPQNMSPEAQIALQRQLFAGQGQGTPGGQAMQMPMNQGAIPGQQGRAVQAIPNIGDMLNRGQMQTGNPGPLGSLQDLFQQVFPGMGNRPMRTASVGPVGPRIAPIQQAQGAGLGMRIPRF